MVKRICLLIIFATLFLIPAVSLASNKVISEDKVRAQIGRLSIPFIENKGQIANDEVPFYVKTFEGTVYM